MIFRNSENFCLSETKIDESFSTKQFCLHNFRIFQLESNGEGIIFYVNVNLLCKSLNAEIDILTETIFIEVNVNVQSSKWLFVRCFKLPSQNKELFISNLSKTTKTFPTKYNFILLMGT